MLESVRMAIQNESQWLLVIDNADNLELFGVDRRRVESVPNTAGELALQKVVTRARQRKPRVSKSATTTRLRNKRRTLTTKGCSTTTAGASRQSGGQSRAAKNLMPYIPTGPNGTVLWTTRDKNIVYNLVGANQGVEVTRMTEDEARNLLANSKHDKSSSGQKAEEINELFRELQWLPLAIYQAGAFMREADIEVEEYLTKLRRGQDRWKTLNDTRHDRYRRPEVSNSVLETFHITIELLRNRNDKTYRTAYTILSTIAYLDSQEIPWEIMKAAAAYPGNNTPEQPLQDDGEVRAALKRLKDLSFLSERKTDTDERSYEIHKLVQEGVRYRLKKLAMEVAAARSMPQDAKLLGSETGPSSTKNQAEQRRQSALAKRCQMPDSYPAAAPTTAVAPEPAGHATDKGDGEKHFACAALQVMVDLFPKKIEVETWKQCEKYLAHAVRVGDYADICLKPVQLAMLLMSVSGFLLHRARWREREMVDLLAVSLLREELGDRDPLTLKSMFFLAETYQKQGRYSEAEELQRQVLDRQKMVLGETHLETDVSLQALASTFFNQGRFNECEEMTLRVFEHRKRVQGDRHPETMISLHNVALVHGAQCRYREAEELLFQVVHLQKEVQGEKHPHALSSMHNLACVYFMQGRYGKAEQLLLQVLQAHKEVLGEIHPATLSTMRELAYKYYQQGRYSEAEQLLLQGLQARKEVLGEIHPDTLSIMHDLACVYYQQGRYSEAEQLLLQVLKARKEVLGEISPDTLFTMHNLACVYFMQGRYSEAEQLLLQVLKARKEVLGEMHPDTLSTMHDLACIYNQQGRYSEAEQLLLQILQACKEVLAKIHPATLSTMRELAYIYHQQGRYSEAEQLLLQVLQARKEVLEEMHPDTLSTMHVLQ